LSSISSRTILLGDAEPGAWHVGSEVLSAAGEMYDPEKFSGGGVKLRYPFGGEANFVRVGGAVFSTERIPEYSEWVLDGKDE
jgi:hypothetical protein